MSLAFWHKSTSPWVAPCNDWIQQGQESGYFCPAWELWNDHCALESLQLDWQSPCYTRAVLFLPSPASFHLSFHTHHLHLQAFLVQSCFLPLLVFTGLVLKQILWTPTRSASALQRFPVTPLLAAVLPADYPSPVISTVFLREETTELWHIVYYLSRHSRKVVYVLRSEGEYLTGIQLPGRKWSLQVIYIMRCELMKEIKLVTEK